MELKDLIKRLYKLEVLRKACIQEATADIGLYFGQLHILEYVMRHECCTQKEIADVLQITPASVAISTKRMQKAGLLEKSVSESSLRCNRLTVTVKGCEMSRRYRAKFNEVDRRMFAGFNEAELEQLGTYLGRLISNISDREPDTISFSDIAALEQKIKKRNRNAKRLPGVKKS